MTAQDILNEMYPPAGASIRNTNANNKLTEQEISTLLTIVDDFEKQKDGYDWKLGVQTLSGVASRFVTPYKRGSGNQQALPLLIQQVLFYLAVRGDDNRLYNQAELMYELTGKSEFNPKGKLTCSNSTPLDVGKLLDKMPYNYKYYIRCRDYSYKYPSCSGVVFSQPAILFNYNGQKDKHLGIAIKNLVYQAGKYGRFLDVFGGTGSASLSFPKRGYSSSKVGNVQYIYNDLDKDLCNLYSVIKSDDYKLLIDELNQLKLALKDGEPFVDELLLEQEVNKFRHRPGNRADGANEGDVFRYRNAEGYADYHDVVKFMKALSEIIDPIGVDTKVKEDFQSLKSDSDYFFAFISNPAFYIDLAKYTPLNDMLKFKRVVYDDSEMPIINTVPTDPVIDTFDDVYKSGMQARFYKYYAYFDDILKSGVEATPVRCALAFIFINYFTTMGSKDVSNIVNMINRGTGKGVRTEYMQFLQPTNRPEQEDIIKTLHKEFQRIDIENKDCYQIIDSVTKDVLTEKEILRGRASKKHPEALIYVDSPYIATKGYKVGDFSKSDMRKLIESLGVASDAGCKFIFSCRATAKKAKNTQSAKDYKDKNMAIIDSVYMNFGSVFIDNNKPLWVLAINPNSKKDFFTDVAAKHEETEIMITNYKIQEFKPSSLHPKAEYKVYDFMTFINLLGQHI